MWAQFYAQYGQKGEAWGHFQEEYARQFGTDGRVCSAAAVQEYLMGHRTNPDTAASAASVSKLCPKGDRDAEPEPELEQPELEAKQPEPEPEPEQPEPAPEPEVKQPEPEPGKPVQSSRWLPWAIVAAGAAAIVLLRGIIQRQGSSSLHWKQRILPLLQLFLGSLRGEKGLVARGFAFAAAAAGWVGLSQTWEFIDRSIWATYSLPTGRDEEAGTASTQPTHHYLKSQDHF